MWQGAGPPPVVGPRQQRADDGAGQKDPDERPRPLDAGGVASHLRHDRAQRGRPREAAHCSDGRRDPASGHEASPTDPLRDGAGQHEDDEQRRGVQTDPEAVRGLERRGVGRQDGHHQGAEHGDDAAGAPPPGAASSGEGVSAREPEHHHSDCAAADPLGDQQLEGRRVGKGRKE